MNLQNRSNQELWLAAVPTPQVSSSSDSTDACTVPGLPTVANLPSAPQQTGLYRLPVKGSVQQLL